MKMSEGTVLMTSERMEAVHVRLSWLSMTAFGGPVVPEV